MNRGRPFPTPKKSTWTLDVEYLSDVGVSTALFAFAVNHDTEEAYFMLGLNGADPPKAIGRVRVSPMAFGGVARTPLTATLTMPVNGTPSSRSGTPPHPLWSHPPKFCMAAAARRDGNRR